MRDEIGDRKDGHTTAPVACHSLGNLGKIENGVVSVPSLWADEGVSSPLEIEPSTPESSVAKGKDDPDVRTTLTIALQLVQHALLEGWPFRAMVADSFDGEDRGVRSGLRQLAVPSVMARTPSHAWWHPQDVAGSLHEVAREAGWVRAQHGCASAGRFVMAARRTGGRGWAVWASHGGTGRGGHH